MLAGCICSSEIGAPERIFPLLINSRISCAGRIPSLRDICRAPCESRSATFRPPGLAEYHQARKNCTMQLCCYGPLEISPQPGKPILAEEREACKLKPQGFSLP